MRLSLVAAMLLGIAGQGTAQQGVFLSAGRVLAGDPHEASWRLTVQQDIAGPVGGDLSFLTLPGSRPGDGELYGVGADVTLFAGARRLPAAFVGVAAGVGTAEQKSLWYGGSVGLRVPIVILGPIRLMAEGRWRSVTVDRRDGVEVALAVGYRRVRRVDPSRRDESAGLWLPGPIVERLRADGIPEAKARLLGAVIATALEEMGQPYVWGGTGDGRGGFDCSGLIQYAYARHGVKLPRTSGSQARAGVAIKRDVDALLPGDILTFNADGDTDEVTHVGLYVGEGRFIHSASNGVRVSRLTEGDGDARWWLRRWVGVRRIVE